jgi:predicted CXXCH cytochrome family protein
MLEPPIPGEFLQAHQTQFLADGLYYPDGQIRDEVYVYDAFKQSKMHNAGVVCSNCHQPHTGKVRAQGNDLCLQCHKPERFDTPSHHHHPATSAGAQCVNCHMPETVYMGVDPRRDHGMKIPRPDLSEQWQIPNACTQCHVGESNDWAAQAAQQWYGSLDRHFNAAPVLAPAWQGKLEALPSLIALAQKPTVAPIVRASAVEALKRFNQPASHEAALSLLNHQDPMLRVAAVQALRTAVAEHSQLVTLVDDPVKAVRMAVAEVLSQSMQAQGAAQQKAKLKALYKEYEAALEVNADMPEAQLQLAAFYLAQKEIRRAGLAYQRAYQLAPTLPSVLVNYADYYRAIGRDDRAKPLLQQALQQNSEQAGLQHAMGLLLVRQQQLVQALPHLAKAVNLAPSVSRYAYVYGVALENNGQLEQAVTVLEQALAVHPDDHAIASALVHYYPRLGRSTEATALRQQLLRSAPQ